MIKPFYGLRGKILLGYLVLLLVLAVAGGWSIYNFAHLNKVLTEITRENYISVLAVERMAGAIERQDSAALLMLLGEVKGGAEIYRIGHEDFLEWLGQEERNITLPGEGREVEAIKRDYNKYKDLLQSLHGLVARGERAKARSLYLTSIDPLFKEIRSRLDILLEMNHQALLAGNERSRLTAWRATASTLAVTALSIILGVLLGLGVSSAIVQPTRVLTEAARRIRAGNLDTQVQVESSDEIGELAQEFNSMVARLRAYELSMTGKVVAEQQKALSIVRAMDDGVLLTDDQGRLVMLNPAAGILLKREPGEVVGLDVAQATRLPEVAQMVERTLAEGVAPHNRTVVMEINNVTRYYDVEVVPVQSADVAGAAPAAPAGTVILLKDVTYFKRLERVKTDFLSDISHEIRTPLTSMTMGLGLLRESKSLSGLAREKEILNMVAEETDRLANLVSELLELSSLESGKARLKKQSTDCRELIERAMSSFTPEFAAKEVELVLEIQPDLPRINLDPDKIRSVLGNLVVNALRYTPPQGKVVLRARLDQDVLAVSVTDDGPGVPLAARDRIFDRFYQMSERPVGQAGLGLPICKAIVQAHGGKIWVDGAEGMGATFVFTLPLRGTEPDTAQA